MIAGVSNLQPLSAEIVDEQALYGARADGRLASAALDVWYRYPTGAGHTAPATVPFHELNNMIMTPHVSGWTEGLLEASVSSIDPDPVEPSETCTPTASRVSGAAS